MFFCATLLAQPDTAIDSLKAQLSKPIADTSKVLLLDQIALKTMNSKPSEALAYATEGLALANKINFEKGKSRNLNRLGAIYRTAGNFAKSLEMHFAALDISEKIGDFEGLARIYNNMGVLFIEQGDYKKANSYIKNANEISTKIGNNVMIETTLINLGNNYVRLEQLDSAQYYFAKVYDFTKKIKSKNADFVLMSLAKIYIKKGEADSAIQLLNRGVVFFKSINDDLNLGLNYYELAHVYKIKNKLDSSIHFAKMSLALAQQTGDLNNQFKSNDLLAKIYEKTDDKLAFHYYKAGVIAKDSLFNMDKMRQMQNFEFRENLRKQEIVDSKKDFESKQKIGFLLALLSAFLLVMVIQFRNNKNKVKANKILNEQKIAIESQKGQLQESLESLKTTQKQLIQQEKLASLGELTAGIAHEIQNPLNFVNNFSEISGELVDEIKVDIEKSNLVDKENVIDILNDLAQNQQKILFHGKRASDIVKAMLDHSRTSTGERTKVNINTLADEFLRLSYLGIRSKFKDFSADYQLISAKNLPIINAVSQDIGRVLLNLINNAFYAVQERQKAEGIEYQPKVIVETTTDKTQIVIKVIDNGTGISESTMSKIFQPFFTTKPTGIGTGLGLSLSYDIVTKGHNGTLEVESKLGVGTTFIVKLPLV